MFLVVGLGNPGKKFQYTPHNLGFIVVNHFQKRFAFSAWQQKKKLVSLISEGAVENQKIILAKPRAFMNNSGQTVRLLMSYYHLLPENLIVVHDDLDIAWQEIKISFDKSAAGHKGVGSIIKTIGQQDFLRLRVGVRTKSFNHSGSPEKFVLKRFNLKQRYELKNVKKKAITALETVLTQGSDKAMNVFNQTQNPK